MWLLENEKAPDHTTLSRFRTGRCAEAAEDLFYQYVKELEQQGETDHKSVFIDGTIIKSRAGRYTFNWRGTPEKNLEKVRKKVLEESGCKTAEELDSYLSQMGEEITFINGKGKHKTDTQREWEALDHLRHLFCKTQGLPPKAYLTRLRCDRASELLLRTDYPISQIAASVGCCDSMQLSKLFKKQMGCAPSQYRRMYKKSTADTQG